MHVIYYSLIVIKTMAEAEAEVIINTKLKPIKVHEYLNPYHIHCTYVCTCICVFKECRENHL